MKRLILLADDSPTIQRLVTQMFTGGEFDVVSVSNGDAAVRKFEEVHPDLILADIYMPGKNGYEVCAAVKKHPEFGDTPVVLLAGAFDAFDEETASQVGAAAHITKPFEPHALLNLVASLAPKEGRSRPASAPASAPVAFPVTPTPPAAMAAAAGPVASATPALSLEVTPASAPLSLEVTPSPEAPLRLEATPTSHAIVREDEKLTLVEEAKATRVEEKRLQLESSMAPVLPAQEAPKEPVPAAAKPAGSESPASTADSGDLLGLQDLFKPPSIASVSDAEIERIAQLVIQKLSTQVIENVAWDVVPDITTKVLKEELKRRS